MSSTDAEILVKAKRIESVNKKKNHNAQKRRKRAEANKALKNEKDAKELASYLVMQRVDIKLFMQEKRLKAVEAFY